MTFQINRLPQEGLGRGYEFKAKAINPMSGEINEAVFIEKLNGNYEVHFPDGDVYDNHQVFITRAP
jgi:hypothetical protein